MPVSTEFGVTLLGGNIPPEGLVIDTTGAGKGLSWLGFLLGPLGLGGRDGAWAYANLGVPVALLIGFVGYLATSADAVRRQEASVVGR